MKSSDQDFEIVFLEGVVRQRPNYIDALVPLSHAYTRRGLYEKGLVIDERLAGLCEHDPIIHYNLSCTYSLLGKVSRAFITSWCSALPVRLIPTKAEISYPNAAMSMMIFDPRMILFFFSLLIRV